MKRQIFINLPVKDLAASQRFFGALGFAFNVEFTNDKAACLVIEEGSIYAMLLREEFFATFTPNPVCDAKKRTEVLVCLSCGSREEVDELTRRAVAAGGRVFREPQEHEGFMYAQSFQDIDGHVWEVMHLSGVADA
jgi:uncharacterized protein